MPDPDLLCIDTIRLLSVDAVEKADSGHPGLPLGAAPMAWVLWDRFLKHNPADPHWVDRDRFVLSAGHGSALLYSLLFLTGYDLTLDDLKQFRQWGSRTPGHPERGETPGVEVTTGPLGQGFANAVGMSIAEAQLAARYNRDGHAVIDHRTFVLASDGDLMEGVASEAASLAGHLRLGKLVCLYDDNSVSLAGSTDVTFSEDCGKRFEAYGWHTQQVDDGNDVAALAAAIAAACAETDRPSLIRVRTHIGFGSPLQDSYKAHGSPLGKEGVAATKRTLGWPEQPAFLVPDEALAHARQARSRGHDAEDDWRERWARYARTFPDAARELDGLLRGDLPAQWDADVPGFPADAKGLASRAAGGKVLNAIANRLPAISGGSADLDPSTLTELKGLGQFGPPESGAGRSFAGRNLHFGVREHAMGAIANGLAAHGGFIPFTATFLTFSDYMRPPMRLAALMGLQVIHVFTHDSIGLGEDGPTHQPVEHITALRAIPGLCVLRPGDANETAVAWRIAIEARTHPTTLILSRQNLPTLDRSHAAPADGVRRGAYVLSDTADGSVPKVILIGTGSELSLVAAAGDVLRREGISARVVSMPSWDLFDAQPRDYRESVLPPAVRARLAVEAGTSLAWHRYVGDGGSVLGVDRFGRSAPGARVLQEYGFTVDNVVARAKALLIDAAGPSS